MANIGKSITIKGDLNGNEDLVIEGNVEGKVELPDNQRYRSHRDPGHWRGRG
jgi:hypothetical protein